MLQQLDNLFRSKLEKGPYQTTIWNLAYTLDVSTRTVQRYLKQVEGDFCIIRGPKGITVKGKNMDEITSLKKDLGVQKARVTKLQNEVKRMGETIDSMVAQIAQQTVLIEKIFGLLQEKGVTTLPEVDEPTNTQTLPEVEISMVTSGEKVERENDQKTEVSTSGFIAGEADPTAYININNKYLNNKDILSNDKMEPDGFTLFSLSSLGKKENMNHVPSKPPHSPRPPQNQKTGFGWNYGISQTAAEPEPEQVTEPEPAKSTKSKSKKSDAHPLFIQMRSALLFVTHGRLASGADYGKYGRWSNTCLERGLLPSHVVAWFTGVDRWQEALNLFGHSLNEVPHRHYYYNLAWEAKTDLPRIDLITKYGDLALQGVTPTGQPLNGLPVAKSTSSGQSRREKLLSKLDQSEGFTQGIVIENNA